MTESCCEKPEDKKFRIDPILHGSLLVIAATIGLSWLGAPIPHIETFAHTVIEFLSTMWWGIAMGMVFVGLMHKIPREYFSAIMGRGDNASGIFRAALAGVFLDLCSHGILMVGAKLYERGASLAQIMTFLIASPWNSFSLTIILIALIGLKWTLLYILGSLVIAIITGFAVQALVRKGRIPANPHKVDMPKNFNFKTSAKKDLSALKLTPKFFTSIITDSTHELKILIKWLLLGVIIAAAIRSFVPPEFFQQWFGPSIIGLLLTLLATTIIEVCSEGSAPIASEIVNNANAPGNGFAFLMAGVATDYTEIMVLKDTTKSWKMALILPLLTVPQILILGYIMNMAG